MTGDGTQAGRMVGPMQAWVALVALSFASTGIAAFARPGHVAGLIVVALAGAKARLILTDYLGLRATPAWRRGFDLALACLLTLFAGLMIAV
jgi:hypothetical protein